MSGATATLNAEQREVQKDLHDRVIRLENELDALIRMFVFARESLENEMLSGMGHLKKGLVDNFPKKLKELTLGMNSVVDTKVRYDKAKRELAKNMTAAEEMDAVVAYIVNLSTADKDALRDKLHARGIFKWKS